MKRVYCNSNLKEGNTYELEEKYYIHLIRVMRLKIGSEISLFNQENGEWKALIIKISKKSLSAEIISKISSPSKQSDINLLFSPIKNLNSEAIVRQSTEIGVKNIYPTLFLRTVIKKTNKKKFDSYATDASQQSGRISIPYIDEYLSLKNRKTLLKKSNVLMFDENLKGISLKNSKLKKGDGDILVVVGPEGGFDQIEREFIEAQSKSFESISLGSNILKADTAVIAALSLAFHYFT